MKFFLHPPAWLSAAQLPLQAAVLAYVGAGGLAGAAVVGGVMLTPAREVVQEAVAPVGQFVESVVPMSVPSFLLSDPRQAVAQLPIGKARAASTASPTAVATPVPVDDSSPDEVVAESTPPPQALLIAPQRTVPAAQNALQPAPGPEPDIGLPLQGGPAPIGPVTAEPPIAAIDGGAPVMPGRPAAAVAVDVRTGSRSEAESDARARATSSPASPRNVLSGSTVDNQRAATVAPPTAIVVHVSTGRTSEPSPTATAVPTARPTSVPTEAPTQVPTVAPTQAPPVAPTPEATQAPTPEPTQAPKKTAAPTQEPKKTAAPTQEPKKTAEPTRVPQRPVKATPVPTRAAPTATPVKEKEKEKRAAPTPTRRAQDDHGGHNGGDGQPSQDHQGD